MRPANDNKRRRLTPEEHEEFVDYWSFLIFLGMAAVLGILAFVWISG